METIEVIQTVQRQFGDETGAQITPADIIRWINEGQFQIARRTGDLLGTQTINVVVGDNKYSLSNDFFKVTTAELDGKRLQLLSEAQLNTLYPDINSTSAQQGVSKFFSIINAGISGSEITLAPIPGNIGSLLINYKSRPPLINSTDDVLSIPEEYHTTLVTYCLKKAKQLDGDDQGFSTMDVAFRAEVADDSYDARQKDDETYPFIRTSPGDYQ